jgi:hypothetical protein
MLTRICTGLETSLLIVVAVELGLFFPMRLAIPWRLRWRPSAARPRSSAPLS